MINIIHEKCGFQTFNKSQDLNLNPNNPYKKRYILPKVHLCMRFHKISIITFYMWPCRMNFSKIQFRYQLKFLLIVPNLSLYTWACLRVLLSEMLYACCVTEHWALWHSGLSAGQTSSRPHQPPADGDSHTEQRPLSHLAITQGVRKRPFDKFTSLIVSM